ncbi:MAG TPA: L-aspartate oxidase, partial [Ferruginibacter sp.]|nr:L-aspartate oxidase [Ferruginibacter sp.]
MAAGKNNKANRKLYNTCNFKPVIAPRDIVARAIDNEMKVNGTEFVYLDCRHMDQQKFLEHFP